jgi:hypothetical protein
MPADLSFEAEPFGGFSGSNGESSQEFESVVVRDHRPVGPWRSGSRGISNRGYWPPGARVPHYYGGRGYNHPSDWRYRTAFRSRWPWVSRGGVGLEPPLQDPQIVAWAQSCLAQLVGAGVPQDGTLGPDTRHAIAMFQSQVQLPATGTLDQSTLAALQQACQAGPGAAVAGAPGGPSSDEASDFPHAFGEVGRVSYETARRGRCRCGASELDEMEEFETTPKAPAKSTSFRYVKNFSGPAAECVEALKRAGKTKVEALTIINTQIGVAITMLRKAAAELKRGSRSSATKDLFLKIFRVRPEFVPKWLNATATIKDRGDVIATRCARVADLLASGTLKFFCAISATNCPECVDANPADFACSSYGTEGNAPKNSNVVCLGTDFWDAMKVGQTSALLHTLMHEPFHIYYGVYVTEHRADSGKFGGIYCIVQFVFEVSGVVQPEEFNDRCTNTSVRQEIGPFPS